MSKLCYFARGSRGGLLRQFLYLGEEKMTTFRPRFLVVAGLAGVAGLLVNVNCGSSGGGGAGGTTGSGGTTSTGGKGGSSSGNGGSGTGGSATGGKGGSGTGGSATGGSSSGGSVGAGGSVSTGGSSSGGSGGSGTGGSGGATGGSGGANTDGGAQTAALSYLFPTSLQGFALDTYNGSGGNLAAVDGGTPPTLTFDNAVGHPDAGSAKVTATFTDYNQFVLSTLNVAPLIDATGKTISAWVMVDAVDGGNGFTGYAQLQINTTTSYHGGTGPGMGLTPGTWTKISMDLTQQDASFDASQIIQVSVKFATGAKGDSGAFPGPETCTFHFDTVTDGSGGAAPPALDVNFDHSSQGFTVGAFGAVPDGGAGATLTWDSTAGNPDPGSIQVALPFSAYNQTYAVLSNVAPPADLSGKTIHARVMLDKVDGGASSIPSGYVQLFAQSNGYKFANGAGGSLTAGTWTNLTMNVSTPSYMATGYDPTQIIQVGIQFGTGGMPDGGTFGAAISPKIHIDSIVAQ
jgi:hypothetical protein